MKLLFIIILLTFSIGGGILFEIDKEPDNTEYNISADKDEISYTDMSFTKPADYVKTKYLTGDCSFTSGFNAVLYNALFTDKREGKPT